MLTELDYKLIKKEEKRVKTKLIPISKCSINGMDDLFFKYKLLEFTIHFYDSSPRDKKCDTCKDGFCDKCSIWTKYYNSEEQLSFNNWIDVFGPGIWGMNQKQSNEMAKEYFKEITSDNEFLTRTFYYYPKENELHIFYYNRDRGSIGKCDYWFVFKRKK